MAQEMSFVDCYLSYFRQRLITSSLLALLPFHQPLFTECSRGDQLLAPPSFSGALAAPRPPLLCVSFWFLVYCSFFFLCGTIIVPRGQCWFISGVLWEYPMMLGAHLLVCWMSPKHVWSWHLLAIRALLFSQCNVVWRRFLWAGDSGS
jgi:hypothetical protein